MQTTYQDEKPFDISNLNSEQQIMLIDKMINGFALHKIILDDNGKPIDSVILRVNPAFEEKIGLKKEFVLGKKMSEVFPDTVQGQENTMASYGAVALGGEPLRTEVYSKDVNKWFLINVYSPQKYYFIFIIKDITELKLNEKRFLENDKRLRMLLEILEYKDSNTQEFLDFALEKSIEMTESKIGYIYFYDESTKLFTLNSWSKEVMQVCTIQEKQTVYELDKTGIWGEAVRQRKPILINDFAAYNPLKKGYPEGHAHLSRFLSLPIFHEDKIIAVVGVANRETDYDDNNILQLQLLMDGVWKILKKTEVENSLKIEQQRFKMYFEKSPQGIFVIDNNAIIKNINPSLAILLGSTQEELIGKNLMTYLVADNIPKAEAGLKELIETGYTEGDYTAIKKDGTRTELVFKLTKLSDTEFLGFCDDITQKQKTIKDLEESNAEMQRLNSLTVDRELKMIQLKNKLTELGIDPSTV
jgi:PAS domain S-box-containing protein